MSDLCSARSLHDLRRRRDSSRPTRRSICWSCWALSTRCPPAGSALLRLNESYVWQSYAQIAVDLLLITWTVNRTGGVDSYFSSLYFLEIVMSSILLERRGAFLAGDGEFGTSFCPPGSRLFRLHSNHDDRLARSVIAAVHHQPQHLRLLLGGLSLELSGGELAQHWRRAAEDPPEQVAFLQAFSDRIIDSLGSGLVTTDMEGRIYLFNRAAEEMTGYRTDDALRLDDLGVVSRECAPKIDRRSFEISTTREDGER